MCPWLDNSSRVEVGEMLALSRSLDTDCRCAVHRAPAGVLKVSRSLRQNDLLLVIPPQAGERVCSIRATRPPRRHMGFVPQHLLKEQSKSQLCWCICLEGSEAAPWDWIRLGIAWWKARALASGARAAFRGLLLLECTWVWWMDSPQVFVRCSWVYVVSQGRLCISDGEPKIQI